MKTQLEDLSELVENFCSLREWDQFHNIKDLSIGLSIEASELLQNFLWKDGEQIKEILANEDRKENIKDEMADIFFLLLRIANLNGVDLHDALEKKIIKNDLKYPVSKFKGSNKKYNEE